MAVIAIIVAGAFSLQDTKAQTAPSISVESPFVGNIFSLTGIIPVAWDQVQESSVVDVVLVKNDVPYHKVYAGSAAGSNSFFLDVSELELPEANNYQIQICDDAIEVTPGNRYCSPLSGTFTLTDDVIPAITAVTPVSGATYNSANSLLISWNQNYASNTVKVTLYGGDGGPYDLGTYPGVIGSNMIFRNIAGLNLASSTYNLEICDTTLVDPNQLPTKYLCGQVVSINITNAPQTSVGLTLVKTGPSGVVNALGTNCISTCNLTTFAGAPIIVVATPLNFSSMFTEWTSGCSGTNRVCVISPTSTTTVTALFSPAFAVSVSKAGSGTGIVTGGGVNCGSTCNARSVLGGSIVLTATPNAGSVFIGWSGQGCSGTGTCTVTSSTTGIKGVTATFSSI